MSEHSNRWDENQKMQDEAAIYGPNYQKFGKRPCICSACHHKFVYECASAACKCCAGG
jgi:hypothetical protein